MKYKNKFIKKIIPLLFLFFFFQAPVLFGHNDAFKIEDYTVSTWNTISGLASDSIITIFQDMKKYIWIGTFDGLLRFNGREFVTFDETISPGFAAHSAHIIVEGNDGSMWIGTENEGLVHSRDEEFHTYASADGLPSNSVQSLAYDPEGRLWIGTSRGLCFYDEDSFHQPVYSNSNPFASRNITSLVYHRDAGLLASSEAGLFRNTDSDPVLIPGTEELKLSAFWSDQNGTVWYGTRDGRLFFWDGDSLKERFIHGMKHTHIRSIYSGGPSGNLLVAGDGGFWSIEDGGFGKVSYLPSEHSILKYIPKAVLEDHEGNIWIGTRTGGVSRLIPSLFTNYNGDDGFTDVTVNNAAGDNQNRLWIAADDGLYCLKNGKFIENNLTRQLAGIRVKHVFIHENELYVSTISPRGVVIYSHGTTDCLNKNTGLPSNVIKKTIVDSLGNIWISSSEGIITVKPDGQLIIRNNKTGFPGNEIYDIFEDSRGRIWAATVRDGLFRFDTGGSYIRFNEQNGLSGEMIFSINEDRQGRFWVSTAVGVYLIDGEDNPHLITYDDGLPYLYVYNALPVGPHLWFSSVRGVARADLEEAAQTALGRESWFAVDTFTFADGLLASPNALSWLFTDQEGRIWIPTHRGLSVLDTSKTIPSGNKWPLYIEQVILDDTAFNINNRNSCAKGTVGRARFRYSALTYAHPHRARYSFFLQGYDSGWSELSKDAEAVYSKLKPGRYIFHVRVYDVKGGIKGEASLPFHITPRYYQTVIYKIVIILIIAASAAMFVFWRFNRMRRQNIKLDAEVRKRTREAEKAHQDQLDLIADISHEIRTPLTVIDYNISNVISGKLGNRIEKDHPVFSAVTRNSSRILIIVNNLLQFFKLRYGESSYHLQPINPDPLLRQYADELRPVAEEKEIRISYEMFGEMSSIDAHVSLFDTIMLNLLTNAISGNQKGGRIEVVLDSRDNETCRIQVADDGNGLTPEELDRIFVPYMQAGKSSSGTGLGLTMVKKAVSRMSGFLEASSIKGKGTVFNLIFPKSKRNGVTVRSDDSGLVNNYASSLSRGSAFQLAAGNGEGSSRKPVVLAVEDNSDLLEIIRAELSREFTVIPKQAGKDGLMYLKNNPAPAAIISDIMMPGMDGRNFFYQVRDGLNLKNIPFLFLTARASFDEAVEFLREGAADYIFKPFSPELLLYKIRNLTALQRGSAESVKKRISSNILKIIEQDEVPENRSEKLSLTEIQSRYSLTDRETEVLDLILTGIRDKEISQKLSCAVSTISNTASRIYKKTGSGSRMELLRKLSDLQ
jgi:signal transduction histidine kinase/ligand-binding sensor domain-containing protein/DNA-binding NarL/FixJ family response regulator